MSSDAFINCRVTPETKALVRAVAQRDGVTESQVIKRLLDMMLRGADPTPAPLAQPSGKVNREARLYVRLENEDWRLLRERAAARGMAPATYVSLLVRSHLRGGAPIPKAEYLALRQSILELTAIGRNVNQIARALNTGERAARLGREEFLGIIRVLEALRDHFKALLLANERAWKGGNG